VTIAVVTSCTGADYHQFLFPWAVAVAGLNRLPDRVIVATDADDDLLDEVSVLLEVWWVRPTTVPSVHPAVIVNDAIAWAKTDWVCRLDVDDVIRPHALDDVDLCDADVYCFGYEVGGQPVLAPPITAEGMLAFSDNPLAACSPWRRWIWERQPYRDVAYDDWAFWRDAARNGARFAPSGRVDYEYRQHPGQFTRRTDRSTALHDLWSLG